MDIIGLAINIIVSSVIGAVVLWFAGKMIVGGEKAKFTDAIWITLLGIIAGNITGFFLSGIIALIVNFVITLYLVKHFFDANWGQAVIIAVLDTVIWIIVTFILSLLLGILVYSWI